MGSRRIRRGHNTPCHWCGRLMLGLQSTDVAHSLMVTVDHVVPRAMHGGDTDNTVLCCRACNMIKASMTPAEWEAFRQRTPSWWNLYTYKKRKERMKGTKTP